MIPPGDDIDRLMALMEAAFDPAYGEAWNRRQVEDALLIGNCHYALLADHGATPAGDEPADAFFLSRMGFDEEELLLLAVDPAHRRKRLASALLEQLCAAAKARGAVRLLLEMRADNSAGALYFAHDFKPVGRRPQYYRGLNGARLDAVTLAKDL